MDKLPQKFLLLYAKETTGMNLAKPITFKTLNTRSLQVVSKSVQRTIHYFFHIKYGENPLKNTGITTLVQINSPVTFTLVEVFDGQPYPLEAVLKVETKTIYIMAAKHDLPNEPNSFTNPLDKWYTKERAMEFLQVCRGTFEKYRDEYGLVCSQIAGITRVHVDDINDFLMSFRK